MNQLVPVAANAQQDTYFCCIKGTRRNEKAIICFCFTVLFFVMAKPAYEFIWYLTYGIGLLLGWVVVLAYQSDYVLGVIANLSGIAGSIYCIALAVAMLVNGVQYIVKAKLESADILYDQRCLLVVCHKSSEETRYVVTQIFKITKENDEFRLWCDICKLEDGVLSNPHEVNFTIEPMSYQRSTKLQEILLNIAATI